MRRVKGDQALTEQTRPEPFFVAEHAALDFLNSVGAPWGSEIEWIVDASDLLRWLQAAGLIDSEVAQRLLQTGTKAARDEVARRARGLREWFRGFVTSHAGRSLDAAVLDDLGRVNQILAQDALYPQIVAEGPRSAAGKPSPPLLRWSTRRHWRSIEDALLPIAEAVGELVCDEDFRRVKQCEGSDCTMWFLDTSKNHTRRWCSMSVCGNRAKAAAFRERQRKRHGPIG